MEFDKRASVEGASRRQERECETDNQPLLSGRKEFLDKLKNLPLTPDTGILSRSLSSGPSHQFKITGFTWEEPSHTQILSEAGRTEIKPIVEMINAEQRKHGGKLPEDFFVQLNGRFDRTSRDSVVYDEIVKATNINPLNIGFTGIEKGASDFDRSVTVTIIREKPYYPPPVPQTFPYEDPSLLAPPLYPVHELRASSESLSKLPDRDKEQVRKLLDVLSSMVFTPPDGIQAIQNSFLNRYGIPLHESLQGTVSPHLIQRLLNPNTSDVPPLGPLSPADMASPPAYPPLSGPPHLQNPYSAPPSPAGNGSLSQPAPENELKTISDALSNLSPENKQQVATFIDAVVALIVTAPPQILALQAEYQKSHGLTLEADLRDKVSPDLLTRVLNPGAP